jgi:hypothetical protein
MSKLPEFQAIQAAQAERKILNKYQAENWLEIVDMPSKLECAVAYVTEHVRLAYSHPKRQKGWRAICTKYPDLTAWSTVSATDALIQLYRLIKDEASTLLKVWLKFGPPDAPAPAKPFGCSSDCRKCDCGGGCSQ